MPQFANDLLGKDWARGFLEHHKDSLSLRVCQNIVHKRAAVGVETVKTTLANMSLRLFFMRSESFEKLCCLQEEEEVVEKRE